MIHRIVRIVSLLALFVALIDAARLLGVGTAIVDPISTIGAASFAYLLAFTLGRLFASVGLWIEANWGTVLLFLVSITELFCVWFGLAVFDINFFGWLLRITLFVGASFLLGFAFWVWRASVHD